MKFKVGDKVKFTYRDIVGQGTIRIVDNVDNSFLPYQVVSENGSLWWLKENQVELIKPDLRELLQVGHKVEYKTDNPHRTTKEIRNEKYLSIVKKYVNQDLIDSEDDTFTINAIYRPKYNGVKPMEWVLVWEREEELFTLQFPITNEYLYKNQLNEYVWEIIGEKFTQKEIDNLPNQELIKALVKKEVKGK